MAVRSVRRTKFKFKWTKELVFLICGLLVMIAATVILALPTKQDKFLNKWSGTSLTKETVITEIKEDKLLEEIKNNEYVFVFYGAPADSTSITNIDIVEAQAQTFEITNVYWLDGTDIYETDEETKATRDFKTALSAREEKLQDVDLLTMGSFWVYENGVLIVDSADMKNASFEQAVHFGFSKSVEVDIDLDI